MSVPLSIAHKLWIVQLLLALMLTAVAYEMLVPYPTNEKVMNYRLPQVNKKKYDSEKRISPVYSDALFFSNSWSRDKNSATTTPLSPFELKGLLISKTNPQRSYALIRQHNILNDTNVKQGDFLGEHEVTKISPRGVVLKKGNVEIELKWDDATLE